MNTQTVITKEVATELLCKPGMRITNKERKSLMRARYTELNPVKFEHLGVQHRLEYRLQQRNWGQLCKWVKRANNRRRDTQAKFIIVERRQAKLGAKTGQPSESEISELLQLTQVVQALNMKAKILDIFLEAVEDEIGRRKKLWESVAKAGAPKFAKQIKKAITA